LAPAAAALIAACSPAPIQTVGDALGGGVVLAFSPSRPAGGPQLRGLVLEARDLSRASVSRSMGRPKSGMTSYALALSPDGFARYGAGMAFRALSKGTRGAALGDVEVYEIRTGAAQSAVPASRLLSDMGFPGPRVFHGVQVNLCFGDGDEIAMRLALTPGRVAGDAVTPLDASTGGTLLHFLRYRVIGDGASPPVRTGRSGPAPSDQARPDWYRCAEPPSAAGPRLTLDGRALRIDGASVTGAPQMLAATGALFRAPN
ncbi:MAG: hypothetical protein AAFU61_13150, partial [Pseudomonadota bacterium]